jgi:hypothetical protein
MRAVSIFSRLLGLDEIRGTSGPVERYQRDIAGLCPVKPPASRVQTPAVPCLDPLCLPRF